MEFIHQPAQSYRLGDYLKANLSGSWTHFRAAVAFAKRSGTRHIAKQVSDFAQNGHVEIIAGIDHRGTSVEGLRDLLEAVEPDGRIIVFHNRLPFTFHPKVYLFKSPKTAEVLIGSGNLTQGGLFTNYEAALRLTLDLSDPDQTAILQSIESVLDGWADTSSGTAHILDDGLLARLISLGLVPSEAFSADETGDDTTASVSTAENGGTTEETGNRTPRFSVHRRSRTSCSFLPEAPIQLKTPSRNLRSTHRRPRLHHPNVQSPA